MLAVAVVSNELALISTLDTSGKRPARVEGRPTSRLAKFARTEANLAPGMAPRDF